MRRSASCPRCSPTAPLLALLVVLHAPLTLALLAVPIVVACVALFALGLGLAVTSVAGHFADVGDMFRIVLSTWMYFTPVIARVMSPTSGRVRIRGRVAPILDVVGALHPE
ncbi:MAG: hypothetical protein ABL982_06425 [Vicinamibacterales bacterium]